MSLEENQAPAENTVVESVSFQLHNKTQLHKTIAVSGENDSKWVSPFRNSFQGSVDKNGKVNVNAKTPVKKQANYSSYISAGSVPVSSIGIKHDAQTTDNNANQEGKEDEEEEEAPLENNEDVTHDEPVEEEEEEETPLEVDENVAHDEEPTDEPAEEAIENEAVETIPTTEIPHEEPSTPSETEESKKSTKPAAQQIPSLIQHHPKMLKRYKENFNITSKIMNKNRIENLDRRVDLGAGLVLTEEQIYELAKKKLQPLMKQIDDRVAENNARDAAAAAKVEETIRLNDEAAVAKELASYKSTVDSKTNSVKAEFEKKSKDLADKAEKSKTDTETHIQNQKDGIVKDKDDSEKAEEKASNDHITNKENLTLNADQLKADKTKELEDSKTKQIEETELAEKFQNDAVDLQSKQVELQKELDAKKAELEEKIKKVEALIATKHEKKENIRSLIKRRKVADRSFEIIDAKYTRANANVSILSNQVGLLNDRLAAHSTKIDHFKTTAKDNLNDKRAEAQKAADDWEEHLTQVRIEEAKKQEQIRIAAEEERKRVEQEKAEEEARLAKEKEEEEARIAKEKEEEEARLAKEKEEEEARLAKEKEEARIAAEKKKKEEEEEAARVAAEVARMKSLKELNDEKLKLEKTLEQQNKEVAAAAKARAEAEAKAAASLKAEEELKNKSTSSTGGAGILSGIGAGIVGATTGIATGVATGVATGASVAGSAASNVASSATGAVGSVGEALSGASAVQKSVEPTSYQQELEASNVGKSLGSNNPFYTGEFTDEREDDIPSTIHEEEEEESVKEIKVPVVEEAKEPIAKKEEEPIVEKEEEPIVEKEEEPIAEKEEEPLNDNATITETSEDNAIAEDTEKNTEAVQPIPHVVTRRRSMVDEAIAHMTPEEIEKMNMPLSLQVKTATSSAKTTSAPVTETKSRSNSITSKLKFKKSSSKLNKKTEEKIEKVEKEVEKVEKAKPVIKSVEQADESTSKPVEKTIEKAVEPAVESAPEPVTEKSIEKVAEPVVESAPEPVAGSSPEETFENAEETIVARPEAEVSIPAEIKVADESNIPHNVTRRRSMVDEAIAHMTREEIEKMNTPLSVQLKAASAANSSRADKIAAASAAATAAATANSEGGSKSRSGSLTSRLKFKRSNSRLKSKSRSNSFKNDAPPNLAAYTSKKVEDADSNASNRTTVNPTKTQSAKSANKKAVPISVAATTAAASAVAAKSSSTNIPATPTIENSSVLETINTTPGSIAPSGISEAGEVFEAKAVEIKPSDESPEKVDTPNSESSDEEDDSDLEPEIANPVFTEKIGDVGETAPTTANTESNTNDNFVEVSTLETVSSNEYHQNKDNPDYMVVH